MNLGSGREISMGDLAQLIGKLVGNPITIESDAERMRPSKSEVERLLASYSLAEKILGWKPEVSLEDGLEAAIAWFRENNDMYRPEKYTV